MGNTFAGVRHHKTHTCCTMKTAFFAFALLAMAAGLEIEWVVTGETTSACIPPGETVNFNWEGPYHNVVELGDDEGAYIDCFLSVDGVYFFLCGVKTHCSAGNQKAEIVVSTN